MSRNCPLQLLHGAQTYLGMEGSRQSEKASRICSSFFRPATWKRQSREVVPAHDGEAAAAAAAVVVDAVGRHLPELRADRAQDLALGLDDAHQAHHVARIVQRDREVVPGRVELEPAADDDVAQERHASSRAGC